MSKKNAGEKICGMELQQMPLLLDYAMSSGLSGQKMLLASAALLSFAVPSSSMEYARGNHIQTQTVLMQCVAKSIPDEIIKRELRMRLREIQALQPDWVDGAKSISAEAIAHMEELIEYSYDLDWCGWELAPYVNGTILLSYNEKGVIASINITGAGASGFIESPRKYITIEETDFNVRDMYDLIRRLSPLNPNRIDA